MTIASEYECVVIGAGPAGTTAAALVAEHGHRTLLVEREAVPRFHVGESLMPETYWTLERLGVLDEMKRSAFVKKLSVQFVNESGRESQPFYFHDRDPHESSQTWQVRRSEFDEMLYKNAAAKGADCRDRTRLVDVRFDGERVRGVQLKTADGETVEVGCRVVVDATGFQSALGTRLGEREANPLLRNASIWTYYQGAHRADGVDEGATIILHTEDRKSWFWYIPLHDDIVSVGVVGETDYLLKDRKDAASTFAEELAKCPRTAERVAGAKRVDEFRVVRDFSYTSKRAAGDGWVLVGDAYTFLDPVYSSGIFLALKSGELAADAIHDALVHDDVTGERLGAWKEDFDRGVSLMAQLVHAFYTDGFSFGAFIREHPEHAGRLTDLLVGKIFHDDVAPIFDDMNPWVERIAAESAVKPAG